MGLSIATRADALEADVLEYLEELNERVYLIVELGLQSVFDQTGERINRCHTFEEFLEGYQKLTARSIPVCVHLIDGLPGENKEMMLESARQVGLLYPHCVKIHLLHIFKGYGYRQPICAGKGSHSDAGSVCGYCYQAAGAAAPGNNYSTVDWGRRPRQPDCPFVELKKICGIK